MNHTLFNKSIITRTGKSKLRLSEASYPLDYQMGFTVFWQMPGCPDECRGILPIEWGINYVPWVCFKAAIAIPITCKEDAFFSFSTANVSTLKSAIEKLCLIIREKRSQSFNLTYDDIHKIRLELANFTDGFSIDGTG